MTTSARSIAPLREFVQQMTRLVDRTRDEPTLIREGSILLSRLIADDGWLPDEFAVVDPQGYRQYLLYCDPLERFSVVSFVWGPGCRTPVHDHTVWGLVGVLRGEERCEEYARTDDGSVSPLDARHSLVRGSIDAVSPTIGDWHVVSNALPDRASVSIHVYGGNIGAVRRHMVDPSTGAVREFISGYSSALLPNLWDRSAEVAEAAGR
jgi:3-mercaptopropionate dioxygenase